MATSTTDSTMTPPADTADTSTVGSYDEQQQQQQQPPPPPPNEEEEQGEIMSTPPASPRPDYYGSLSSPISPAESEIITPPSLKPKRGGKTKRKPFLFRLLGKKKKAAAAADAAGLAPPALTPTFASTASSNAGTGTGTGTGTALASSNNKEQAPEPQIDWLENKEKAKKTKQAGGGGLFKSFRNNKNNNNKTEKTDLITPPRGTWPKKKPEPLKPKKATAARHAERDEAAQVLPAAAQQEEPERLDSIKVEETYVTEEDETTLAEQQEQAKTKTAVEQDDPTVKARRKAVIQDSWDFYRLICSLVCDRDRYQETFRMLQKDPVYPYLDSLMSVNDPGDVGYENFDKPVVQADDEAYQHMPKLEVAQALERKANETLPDFVEVCKSLAGNLGVEQLGIGPIKEAAVALRKAQRKYDGDLLKVTDYCRALIIVDDLAALLGLLELMRDSYGELIRRVKLSTLKTGQKPKVGGYRDCIINMEINGHICELQVHLKPLWEICKTKGYKHHVHSLEYKTDSFKDAYASLRGLDRKALRELIALADDLTKPYPLDDVTPHQENIIMDYFAMAGLYYKVGSYSFAEIYFSRLAEIRMESLGALHPQTDFLHRYLVSSMRKQNKNKDANLKESEFALAKVKAQKAEKEQATCDNETAQREAAAKNEGQPDEIPAVGTSASFWDTLSDSIQQGTNSAYDLIMDPNRKVREEEEAAKAKIKASKQVWRSIRRERYPFLEGVREEGELFDDDDDDEREDVEDAALAASEPSKDAPPSEEPMKTEKTAKESSHDEPVKVESVEKQDEAVKESPSKEEATKSEQQPAEHVEEKKEDGESQPSENKDNAAANQKALVVDDEAPSALDRLMEQACSLCATNTTSSS